MSERIGQIDTNKWRMRGILLNLLFGVTRAIQADAAVRYEAVEASAATAVRCSWLATCVLLACGQIPKGSPVKHVIGKRAAVEADKRAAVSSSQQHTSGTARFGLTGSRKQQCDLRAVAFFGRATFEQTPSPNDASGCPVRTEATLNEWLLVARSPSDHFPGICSRPRRRRCVHPNVLP